MEIGVEAEISINKDGTPKDKKEDPSISLLSVGGFASGMAKTEVITIGYSGGNWKTKLFRKGVYIDVTAGGYVTVLGIKYEPDTYYRKIQVFDPPTLNE